MVIYDKYDIVFQEIPNEVSLAFTLKGCINNCIGCHSPHLREKFGNELSINILDELIDKYNGEITCILFLGGDGYIDDIIELSKHIKSKNIKVAMYSGNDYLNYDLVKVLDYYKIGSYQSELGGLNNAITNQRLYKIECEKLMDITNLFWK